MNRRLQQFLEAENISQAQFAETLKVARGSVSHILAGRNRPGYDFLESLALHYPELNLEWLITGRGRMYKESGLFVQEEIPQESVAAEPLPQRRVSRIVVFYDDNTFDEFQ